MQKKSINKADQMLQHIEACKVSGLYVEQYCKEQNLKPATYYYWRKKLQTNSQVHTGSFIELQPITTTSCVEIVFTNGVRIHFESLVPVNYIKQLIG
jgi:hypothetical protein